MDEEFRAQLAAAAPELLKELRRLDELEIAEECSRSLHRFVEEFWEVVEPSRAFVDNWHLRWLCAELEAITRGDTIRALFNVPPGAMKEVHVDEPVLTKRGRIRLGDVVVGDKILTHRGRFRRVEKISDKGLRDTLIIKTWMGREVRAEVRHPFLTTRGWIEAKDLRVGDILAAVSPMKGLHRDVVDGDAARFLGYMVGDGGVTHSPLFTNSDEEILADFARVAASVGASTVRRPEYKGRRYAVGVNGIRKFLEKHGLWGCSSYTKRIPPAVLASSNAVIAEFLSAYWSCDGHIHVRHTGVRGSKYTAVCTTVSLGLAEDLQHALLRLGISSRIRKGVRRLETAAQPGGLYTYFVVVSESHEETVKFKALTGMCSAKAKFLEPLTPQCFHQGPLHEDRVISIYGGGRGECRCLRVEEDHSFTAGDLAVHNSLLVSVFWPAWEWGPCGFPAMRYLLAAYTQDLTLRDNRRCKTILQSEKYRRMWPEVVIDPRRTSDENFANTKTGWRIATSPGGLGTGERADRIIIDDPHSVKTADSDVVRGETLRWWREVIPTRVNDPQRSAMVVIMQRVHEEDVAGDILENRGSEWVHVMIPMKYEPDRHCRTDQGEDPRSEDGELYWPERFPDWTVERDGDLLGRYGVAAQFQQMPSPRGGGIVLREWWKLWPPEGEEEQWEYEVEGVKTYGYPPWEFQIAYLDTAMSEAEGNAWSALVRFGVFADSAGRPRVMMAGAWRDRPTVNELAKKVLASCEKWGTDILVIENKAGGAWVKQELERLMRGGEFSIVLDDPKGDKGVRLHGVSPLFENGIVFAPDKPWADMVISEVAMFPKGKWRDLTDCVSGALGYLRRGGLIKLAPEHDEEEHRKLVWRGRRETLEDRYGI